MTTSPWNNDLAKAYDEKYTILEEARLEYDHEVRALLERVASAVQAGPLDARVEQTVRAFQLTPDEPGSSGRWTLEYVMPVIGAESQLFVSAWLSSPWESVPGYLYLAILLPDSKPWQAAQLRTFGQSQNWANGRSNVLLDGPMSTHEGIYAERIELASPDLVFQAAQTLQRFLLLACDAASHLRAERNLELRVEELLVQTRAILAQIPEFTKFPGHSTEIDDWQGQRYLQLSPGNGQPGFWIGYHAERGALMFGHNKKPGSDFDAQMRDALRKRVGCESFERYEEYPGGTLLDRQELRTTSEADILRTMQGAFEAFAHTLSQQI